MKRGETIPVLLAAALERMGTTVAVFDADELKAVEKHAGIETWPQANGSVAVMIVADARAAGGER